MYSRFINNNGSGAGPQAAPHLTSSAHFLGSKSGSVLSTPSTPKVTRSTASSTTSTASSTPKNTLLNNTSTLSTLNSTFMGNNNAAGGGGGGGGGNSEFAGKGLLKRMDSVHGRAKELKNFYILSMGHRIQFMQYDDAGVSLFVSSLFFFFSFCLWYHLTIILLRKANLTNCTNSNVVTTGQRNDLPLKRGPKPRRRKVRFLVQLRVLVPADQRVRHDDAGVPQVQRH